MAADADTRWPDWQKVATKGDVIGALVSVKRCLVDIALALSAAERGDDVSAKVKTKEALESLERLSKRIDEIGGMSDG